MLENKYHILSTRPVEATSIEAAAAAGIQIDILSFIETTAITTTEVIEEIQDVANKKATVIFTSMNAVEAVAHQLPNFSPDWKIFCLGSTTKDLCEQYFGATSIRGTAPHAGALAESVINAGIKEPLFFFCGNRRRDELPDKLQTQHLNLKEIVVYETHAIQPSLQKDYDGILFFSPSAVESFFSASKIQEKTVLFAIGNTTATAIRNYTDHTIIISDHPGKENLVQKMIAYFSAIS